MIFTRGLQIVVPNSLTIAVLVKTEARSRGGGRGGEGRGGEEGRGGDGEEGRGGEGRGGGG